MIESTSKIVTLNGVPARIWEGTSERGIKMHCYITRVAISTDEPTIRTLEFEDELLATKPPSPEVDLIPARLIL